MKPIDVKTSIYVHFDLTNNNENRKNKVRDHVKISKYN